MEKYDLSGLKVLITEKQAPMRTLIRQVLREFGIRKIFEAASPEDGFDIFNRESPDLVLCDWAPDFDGLSLLRNIRTHPDSVSPQTPVIMVTAYNETTHIYEALDSGMTEYLSKPLSAKLLYTRFVTVIENKRRFIRAGHFTGPDRRRRHTSDFGGENRRDDSDA